MLFHLALKKEEAKNNAVPTTETTATQSVQKPLNNIQQRVTI